MANIKKIWAISYRESKRHRKVLKIELEETTAKKAEKLFRQDRPEAVICSLEAKNEWDDETLESLSDIFHEAERMKNCYFWGGQGDRSRRAWYEQQHSVGYVEWYEGGTLYGAKFKVTCAYSYTKAKGYYYRNGEATTRTTIENSYRRMKEAAAKK